VGASSFSRFLWHAGIIADVREKAICRREKSQGRKERIALAPSGPMTYTCAKWRAGGIQRR
jgi:hypothetical protein